MKKIQMICFNSFCPVYDLNSDLEIDERILLEAHVSVDLGLLGRGLLLLLARLLLLPLVLPLHLLLDLASLSTHFDLYKKETHVNIVLQAFKEDK